MPPSSSSFPAPRSAQHQRPLNGKLPPRVSSKILHMGKQSVEVPLKKATKRRTAVACVACHTAKAGCDSARPCRRCVRLGKGDSCVSRPHQRIGRPRRLSNSGVSATSTQSTESSKCKVRYVYTNCDCLRTLYQFSTTWN